MATPIVKSSGTTRTERYLSELCDSTFLRLWSYANPFRAPGKELCDLLAVFDDHVFLFFDRELSTFASDLPVEIAWPRWKKEAIDKQLRTANRAKQIVLQNPSAVYIDAKCSQALPIALPRRPKVHKIIVAHGASDACLAASPKNLAGSLAVMYANSHPDDAPFPFFVRLDRSDPAHVLDSHNVEVILKELDTVYDFTAYIEAKETAIAACELLSYCGEEDLLAYYYQNFDERSKRHFIYRKPKHPTAPSGIVIGEGHWLAFERSDTFKRKRDADRSSYLWDRLLQRTLQNALDGTLLGDADIFQSRSAVYEMAKEPRFMRRALSDAMLSAIRSFPDVADTRNMTFMPSYFPTTAYVFLQFRSPVGGNDDFPSRRAMAVQVACAAAKMQRRELTRVIGIAMDAPKFNPGTSEDFVLLDCEKWTEDDDARWLPAVEAFKFFRAGTGIEQRKKTSAFPPPERVKFKGVGRNEACPCGSGRKFKKCHGG